MGCAMIVFAHANNFTEKYEKHESVFMYCTYCRYALSVFRYVIVPYVFGCTLTLLANVFSEMYMFESMAHLSHAHNMRR